MSIREELEDHDWWDRRIISGTYIEPQVDGRCGTITITTFGNDAISHATFSEEDVIALAEVFGLKLVEPDFLAKHEELLKTAKTNAEWLLHLYPDCATTSIYRQEIELLGESISKVKQLEEK